MVIQPLDPRERKKRRNEIWAAALLLAVFLGLTAFEFQLTRFSNSLPFVNSIFFFGLLNVNIVILVALVWLIFRNIGKVFIERRRRLLGSRLKTKLVIAFFAFSIIPTVALFIISALYINSSFDKWFSLKIQNTFQASLEISEHFYKQNTRTARHFAEHLSSVLAKQGTRNPRTLLQSQRELLALDVAEFYADPFQERVIARAPTSKELDDGIPRLSLELLQKAFQGESVNTVQHLSSGDLIRSLAPVKTAGAVSGIVAVGSFVPVNLVDRVDSIALVFDDYRVTNPLKYPMKTAYLVILVMITLVILLVAIWIGLYLARELTVPVEHLVQGAGQVADGNLDVTLESSGHDEISVLIESFNRMTQALRESRQGLQSRTLQLEAVLSNVGTGVLVVDQQGMVITFNRAVSDLLKLGSAEVLGQRYSEIFKDSLGRLSQLIQDAESGSGPQSTQWTVRLGEEIRSLSAIATPLRDPEHNWGVVVVIDDMTLIVKGQREMAWREVARRIAHEIKNPLTPIKLSAQRLQRRLGDIRGREGVLLQECTDTIIKHTDELKEMVNEFSSFARFPEIHPEPNDLNSAITEVISLFTQAHPSYQFVLRLEDRLPIFDFDRDQLKRVMINLLDNAVGAVKNLPPGRSKRIEVATHYNDKLQIAVIEVSDNGPGMTDEVRARVFEPYFSTKSDGTGLGLAICKRIVNDHDGFIRAHSVFGEGTQFLIELPTVRKIASIADAKKGPVHHDQENPRY